MIDKIRNRISREEFDYQMLLDCLQGYSRPRDKISDLIKKGHIIRIKKGLYIFGQDYRKHPYSRETLANLIYGPSCISLEYALSYHGMIPERSESITSIATGRSRTYTTPVGVFSYRTVSLASFRSGVMRVELEDGGAFLISSHEKALSDKIHLDRGTGIRTQKELEEYLLVFLRIDPLVLKSLDPDKVADIGNRYKSFKVRLLSSLIKRMQRRDNEAHYA
ncbi:MAG TPA: hypothetical protein ENN05_02080 [Deltaproteobacteria bacterium]|nr:hypothetical protein [Deltaproteobacteria bacterium]